MSLQPATTHFPLFLWHDLVYPQNEFSILKINLVFKSLDNIYKIQMFLFHLLKQTNNLAFRYLGQFAQTAWTPMIDI